jgi:hypothetical protein
MLADCRPILTARQAGCENTPADNHKPADGSLQAFSNAGFQQAVVNGAGDRNAATGTLYSIISQASDRTPPGSASMDLDLAWPRLCPLGDMHPQHAVLETGLDPVGFQFTAQCKTALVAG